VFESTKHLLEMGTISLVLNEAVRGFTITTLRVAAPGLLPECMSEAG
jgi:hypothetical protein